MKKTHGKKVLIIMLLLFSAFNVSLTQNIESKAKVKLSTKKIIMYVGKHKTIQLKGTKKKIKWNINRKKILVLHTYGKNKSKVRISAKKAGTAKVTAKLGKKKYTCTVIVKKKRKSTTKPNLSSNSENKILYGTVSGNITYHYNQYRGYVADTKARVYLIPTNGAAAKEDISFNAVSVDSNELRKKNIYAAQVDGLGNYTISNIPEGEYMSLIISHNCTLGTWFNLYDDVLSDAPDTFYDSISSDTGISNYLTDTSAMNLAKTVAFYNYHSESIVVYGNNSTILSYAFPYTYI